MADLCGGFLSCFFNVGGLFGFFLVQSVMGQMRHRQVNLEWSKMWHCGRLWGGFLVHTLSLQLQDEQDLGPNQSPCVIKHSPCWSSGWDWQGTAGIYGGCADFPHPSWPWELEGANGGYWRKGLRTFMVANRCGSSLVTLFLCIPSLICLYAVSVSQFSSQLEWRTCFLN